MFSQIEAEVGAAKAQARLLGTCFDPTIHHRGREVKAVTHHGLKLAKTDRGFEAYVLVDI